MITENNFYDSESMNRYCLKARDMDDINYRNLSRSEKKDLINDYYYYLKKLAFGDRV